MRCLGNLLLFLDGHEPAAAEETGEEVEEVAGLTGFRLSPEDRCE